MKHLPILWSFRRCPYAIRARLAILSAGVQVELREILLRDKPEAFLQTSASSTVPALRLPESALDESLDIMIWALEQNDPAGLLDMPDTGWTLIKTNDGPFKSALDHTKYTTRYPHLDAGAEREKASGHLFELEQQLNGQPWLFGSDPTLADLALLPFVRQFAFIDKPWFDAQPWPNVIGWLDRFLDSAAFASVMTKHPVWTQTTNPILFGGPSEQIHFVSERKGSTSIA